MATRLATDIITFYHPQFWGLSPDEQLQDWAAAHLDIFWDKRIRDVGKMARPSPLMSNPRPGLPSVSRPADGL